MPGAGRVVATAANNSETTISWVDETKSTVAKRGVGKCHAAPRRTRERSDADAAVLRISQWCDPCALSSTLDLQTVLSTIVVRASTPVWSTKIPQSILLRADQVIE